jgi:O-antigen ligase
MATGTDLLPLPGAGLYFAGSIMRPNGPFLSDNSFGLIGLITFFFTLFLRRAIRHPIPWWQRLLHISGAASALATALMPLFRSVGITLLIILLLDMYFKKDTGRAVVKLALILSAFGALAILSTKAQDAYQDRMDTANVYTRIAEMKQIVELVKLHTLTGLGVANFENAAKARAQSVGIYKGYEAADYPHNNLGAILTETGLMGFAPYVAAQIFLFMCFMRLKSSEPEGSRQVWTCFLYVFLSYWVNGMSLTAGYYSDLNLWYVFVLMVLYKYAITESRAPSVLRTPGLSFGSADGILANVAR